MINKKIGFVLILLFVILGIGAITQGNTNLETKIKKPLNIILIMSDDQSWEHIGANGNTLVKTPNIDLLAKKGVNFINCYNSAPACAPSRASMLTGKNFWELGTGAIHFSDFPSNIPTFIDLLSKNNYQVGYTGKAWGPGNWKQTRDENPSGKEINTTFYADVPEGINKNYYAGNFKSFYEQKGEAPFFFWLGTTEPHRPMVFNKSKDLKIDLSNVKVPDFLPNADEVKSDIADYYYEINWLDKQIGEVYQFLKEKDELKNTLIVFTSDNGMPFPRAKSNLYDYGSRLPLIISLEKQISENRVVTDFVNLKDLATTFLDFAGVSIPKEMNGKSLKPLLQTNKTGRIDSKRNYVVMGKELHAWCHPKGEINPVRAIRTDQYLYIQNIKPEMWPAGHPNAAYSWDLEPFGDVDQSPTKSYIIENATHPDVEKFHKLAFGKRPSEELYDVEKDPYQLKNLAYKPGFQKIKKELSKKMKDYLIATKDPRTLGNPSVFDKAPYYWSHGLETAGLPLYIWDHLTEDEKLQKIDSVSKSLKLK